MTGPGKSRKTRRAEFFQKKIEYYKMKENQNSNSIAVIAGATGLVGGYLLQILQNNHDYQKIITVGRRKPDSEKSELRTDISVDFANQNQLQKAMVTGCDLFICLGTTIKKAGSQSAFRVVDFDYPINLVEAAIKVNARSIHIVTALGADDNSGIFYNRVKGEVEQKAKEMGESSGIPIVVYRPSLLLGDREEFRAGEKIASAISFLAMPLFALGPLKTYKPVHAKKVAVSMIQQAKRSDLKGFNLVHSEEMQAISLEKD
jgi:uncharacterized protein YbjT (DUF2867 family)